MGIKGDIPMYDHVLKKKRATKDASKKKSQPARTEKKIYQAKTSPLQRNEIDSHNDRRMNQRTKQWGSGEFGKVVFRDVHRVTSIRKKNPQKIVNFRFSGREIGFLFLGIFVVWDLE